MNNVNQNQELVFAITASPEFERDGICFAACQSGLYCSTDGGASWQNAFASLDLKAPLLTMSVILSPHFTSDRTVIAGVAGGVLRSSDGGETWRITQLREPAPLVSSLVISPNFYEDGILLAGTNEDGIFRSSDRGEHWSAWNFGLLDLNIICLAISPDFPRDETLFAGTELGIFRSTNGGRAWREIPGTSDFAPVLSLVANSQYAKASILYAGTEDNGLFKSIDGGQHWETVNPKVLREKNINAIILSPEYLQDPEFLLLLGKGIWLTRDDGHSFSSVEIPLYDGGEIYCVAAPLGLQVGAPLFVGVTGQGVMRAVIP